jgi:hypothetical protein
VVFTGGGDGVWQRPFLERGPPPARRQGILHTMPASRRSSAVSKAHRQTGAWRRPFLEHCAPPGSLHLYVYSIIVE